MCIYLPKRAAITEIIAPITTIQPAIAVIITGINGIVNTGFPIGLIIPDPTARDTNTPTTHAINAEKLKVCFAINMFQTPFQVLFCLLILKKENVYAEQRETKQGNKPKKQDLLKLNKHRLI